MAHRFEIPTNKKGELVACFMDNSQAIFWTEGNFSKSGAANAIEPIEKNDPGAETIDA